MSDKETAPWMRRLEIAIRTTKFHREEISFDCILPSEVADQIMELIAVECTAPAPQPCGCCSEMLTELVEFTKCPADDDVVEHVKKLLGATPQVTQELELEQEADGRWLAAYTRFPGVAAYGPSREEAIRIAAKVLIEDTPHKSARLRIALDAIVRCSIQCETGECLICGADDDRHTDDCPVLEAERILNEYPIEGTPEEKK